MTNSNQEQVPYLPAAESGPPARLLRLPEVMARVGLRRSAIYQRMSEGRFPKSRSLGPKCAVWVKAEIDRWIEETALENNDVTSMVSILVIF